MSKFRALIALCVVFSSIAGWSQTTNVTATVTDSDGIAWAYGSWTASYQNGNPYQSPTVGGHAFPENFYGYMDSAGHFTTTLTQTSAMTPKQQIPSSGWVICVADATSASRSYCTAPLAVTGSTLDLSSAIGAITTPPRPTCGSPVAAYADVEVSSPTPGCTYLNLITQKVRLFSSGAWADFGGGSGGGGSGTSSIPGNLGQVVSANGNSGALPTPVTIDATTGNTYIPGSVTLGDGVKKQIYLSMNCLLTATTNCFNLFSTQDSNGYNVAPGNQYQAAGAHFNITNFAAGLRSVFQVEDNEYALDGDYNGVHASSVNVRAGATAPADEAVTFWERDQGTEISPYFGAFSSVSNTKHNNATLWIITPQANIQSLVAGGPIIDTTATTSDTVSAVTASGTQPGNLTTSGTHATSTHGTLSAGIGVPNGNLPENLILSTFNVAFPGTITTGSTCSLYGASLPEFIVPQSVTPISGGYTLTAYVVNPHGVGDSIACGGMVGQYIDYTNNLVNVNQNGFREIEDILESPTTNTLIVGHPAYGKTYSTPTSGPVLYEHGAFVVDSHNWTYCPSAGNCNPRDGYVASVVPNTFTPNAGDVLQQPNAVEAHYAGSRRNIVLFSKSADYYDEQLNFLGPVSGRAKLSLSGAPNMAITHALNASGPIMISEGAPNASYTGSGCDGIATHICDAQLPNTGAFDIFTGLFSAGGAFHFGMNNATQRAFMGPTDFAAPITVGENAQNAQGEYGFLSVGSGPTPNNLSFEASQGGTIYTRFGYAYGPSLTPGYTVDPVTSTLGAIMHDTTYFQLHGHGLMVACANGDTAACLTLSSTGLTLTGSINAASGTIGGSAICTANGNNCPSGTGSGGGTGAGTANYPSTPGIVFNTSSTAARNANSTDLETVLAQDTSTTSIPMQYNAAPTLPNGNTSAIVSTTDGYPAVQTANGTHKLMDGARQYVSFVSNGVTATSVVVALNGYAVRPVCIAMASDGTRTVISATVLANGTNNWNATFFGDGVVTEIGYECGAPK